ncbi:hypothetical protein HMI54_007794 [Coelomomyces lativittatus]|nr:hypothetical protein HMI54_007794 [Coelomomyces lativittatus]
MKESFIVYTLCVVREPQETLPKVSYWEQPPPWDPPLVLHDVLELIVVQLLRSPFSSTTKVLSYFHTLAQWDPPKLLSIFTRFYRLSPVPKKNHSAKKKPFSMPFPHLVFLMSLFHQVFFDLAAAGSTISSSSAPQVTQRLCPRPQVSVPCQRTLIDTLVSLFLYQCLPQPFTTYFNMVRQRTTPILLTHHPTAFSSTSNHASTKSFSSWSAPSSATLPPSHLSDVSSTTTTSAAAAAAAAAAQLQLQPPPPPPTPLRAGNSFFSFFSYLSTTFQSTEPTSVLNEEDQRHYQWVLTGCDIHHFFHENLIDLMPMLLDSIPRYPQATGFILHWCMTLMLHHPLSLSSSTSSSSLSMEEKKVSNPKTVPSFLLRFLDAWQHYLQLHSAHAVHLLLQLCPKYGSLVPSPYFQMMVPQHLPIDACVHLDTSMYECVIPYYSPDMYLGLLQKYPDEVHRWLLAYPTTMTQKHWKKWLLTINQVPLPSASKRGVHVLHGLVHHGQVFQQFHLLTLYLTVVARKVTEVGATALVYFEQAFLNVSVSKQVNKDEKRNKLNPRTSHPHSPNTSSSSSSSSSSSPSLSPSPSPRLVNPSSSSSSQKPMSPEPLHNETQLPLLPPLLPPPSTSKKEDPKEPDPLIEEDPWSLLQRVVIPLLRHYKWTQRHEELVRLIGVLCKWFLNVLDTFEPDVLVQVWDTLITEILEYVQQSEYLVCLSLLVLVFIYSCFFM